MKRDLDDLIREYAVREKQSELRQKGSKKNVAIKDSFSWGQRGLLLVQLLEEKSGAIAHKKLINEYCQELGFENSSEGKQYLKNFISWFLHQGIIRKKSIKGKTYITLNSRYNSDNIRSYFKLWTKETGKSESRPHQAFKKDKQSIQKKRLSLLKSFLAERGPLPENTILEHYLAELGFTQDHKGKAEAKRFFATISKTTRIRLFEKDHAIWIEYAYKRRKKTQKEHKSIVLPKEPADTSKKVVEPVKTSAPSIPKESSPKGEKKRVERKKSPFLVYSQSASPATAFIEMHRILKYYEEQSLSMDNEMAITLEKKRILQNQLLKLEELITTLMPHRIKAAVH